MTEPTTPVAPLLVDASVLAALLNVSLRHIHRLDALGQVPEPIRLGRSVRWNGEEIKAWVAAGAPPRSRWNLRSDVGGTRGAGQ
jgi:predicted DNA-binding transcriptional regulator AlpA